MKSSEDGEIPRGEIRPKMAGKNKNEQKDKLLILQRLVFFCMLYRGVIFMSRPVMDIPDDFEKIVESRKMGKIKQKDAIKMCNVSKSTFFRRIKDVGR